MTFDDPQAHADTNYRWDDACRAADMRMSSGRMGDAIEAVCLLVFLDDARGSHAYGVL